jgi:hypothetical protein
MMDVIDDMEWQSKALTKSVTPLLEGSIDMHYHGYPELTLNVRTRMDDVEVLKLASNLGMRGIVIRCGPVLAEPTIYVGSSPK